MRGYLLDTNVLGEFLSKEKGVYERFAKLPERAPVNISSITLGEIEFGHRFESPDDYTDIQIKYREIIFKRFPSPIHVTEATAVVYGELRAKLFLEYVPNEKKKKARWTKQLQDPATDDEIGIQENDIWIAAQALERKLILVSHDKHMRKIKDVEEKLLLEDWAD